ncbi:hypothetical protein ABZ567_12765 [Streptomyces sp. NPDC016459]|uniref:hypothetical protein n=1 Tax=Streptomyces sp. NPDC016459 TaxID=3157190 RepID=UPI0033D12788
MRSQNHSFTSPSTPFPTVKLTATQETGPVPATPRPSRELPRTGHRQAPTRTRFHAPRRTY